MPKMVPFRAILVTVTLVTTATSSLAVTSPATRTSTGGIVRSDEISGQRRHARRNYVPPAYNYAPQYYRGSADPSIGPDGRPYRVPEYLRNQCYVDDGYGRFSACSNR
jgi:hypothetical protein